MSYWNGAEWVSEQPDRPEHAHRGRRLFGATLEATLILALTFGLIAGTAFAAKGGNGGGKGGGKGGPHGGSSGTSSLAVVMVDDQNADGSPDWGDTITFTISTTATDSPYLELTCSQGGTIVYSAWAGFYDSYPWPGQKLMPLSSPSWTAGAANCTAVLNGTLATLNFDVGA